MRTLITPSQEANDSENNKSIDEVFQTNNSSSKHHQNQKADLQLIAFGNIRLETLSWIEAIRRKHGFLREEEGTLPPSAVGRTAQAKNRLKDI